MIIKYKETGNESAIELELFKEHLAHNIDQFEFINGTKEEKKEFNTILKNKEKKITPDEELYLTV